MPCSTYSWPSVTMDPVDRGRFHRDLGHPARRQPRRHLLQIAGKGAERTHRLIAAFRVDRHEMPVLADVDPCAVRVQALDLGHHPDLAVVDLLGQEVVALHGLFEGEEVLLAPRPLKARGDRIGVGLDGWRSVRRSGSRSPSMIARRMRWPVSPVMLAITVEPDVHLGQCLLHVQDAAGAVPGQPPHLACVGAQPHRAPGRNAPREDRRTSLPDPLAVQHVARARRSASSCAAARITSTRAPASRRPGSSRPRSTPSRPSSPRTTPATPPSPSRVKEPNERTGSSLRSGSTATKCRSLPMSIPPRAPGSPP